jgi:PTH1 family peptidyl-tRNA hydrolase
MSSWRLQARTVIEGENVLFVKPQTFMNKSGESIEKIISYYKVDPKENLIVLVDDIMLDAGRMRIRKGGSAGGHNGLKSIIECTGTDEFKRIRLGVGKLENGADMVNHVLSKLPDSDRGRLEKIFEDVSGAISLIIKGEFDAAMNRYNGIQEQ